MKTAYDLVWMAAQRTPDHPALVDDRSDRSLTYRELIEEIDTIAAGLAERGIRRGSRIATVLPNLFEHALVLLALARLGAVPALLNVRLGAEELVELARRARARGAVVLPDPDLVETMAAGLGSNAVLLSVGEEAGRAEDFARCRRAGRGALPEVPRPHPEDESFLFYTSGTTGLPKAVVIPHRANEPRITWVSTMLGLRSGPHLRTLGVSPLSHAIGFHGVFLVTLAYNGTFHTLSAFDPDRAVELVERRRINYLFSLPTIYAAMAEAPSYRRERMASLGTVFWGGAAIEPALLERLAEEWPARLCHVYGTTETMASLVHPSPLGCPDTLLPSYSTRVRVVSADDPDREAEPGEEGELLVDATGDAVFSGYLDQPEATAEKMRNGWYHTGDSAVRTADGSIRLLGRIDDMIRSGGEYIQPEEVERCLGRHPEVGRCAVVGARDPRWGQVAVACVVASARSTTLGEQLVAELDRHCRASPMANFKRPRGYLFLDTLPLSAANKLERKVLRERAERARRGEGEDLYWAAISGGT